MKIDSAPLSDTSPRPESPTRPDGAAAPERNTAVAPEAPVAAEAPVAYRRRPLSRRARVGIALGLAALLIIFLLVVRSVIRPFIWAAVVCYILTPVVAFVQRRLKLRRGASAGLVMLVLAGLVGWGTVVAVPQLRSDITALANSLSSMNAYLTGVLPNAGTPTILGIPIQVTAIVRNIQLTIGDLPNLIFHNTISVASNVIGVVLHLLTFLITTFYLLLDAPRLGYWLGKRIPPTAREEVSVVARQVNAVLSEYLRAEVILILLMTAASLVALTILGVPFALVLAPIVGFLEILPIIGPFFAIALVTIVALIGPTSFGLTHVSHGVVVALVFFVMRQLEDYLVIPNVVGHAVKLHPVIILFALLCGATIGGILGMFLAVPVMGMIRVLGSHVYDRLVE